MPMTTKKQIKQPQLTLKLWCFLLHSYGNAHQQILAWLGKLPNCVTSQR